MEPKWLSSAELEAWKVFLAASQRIETIIDSELRRDVSISHSEYEILIRLGDEESGSLRMGELAKAIIMGKSALTYKIASLEKHGYVRKVPCDSDARGLMAEITDAGRALLRYGSIKHLEVVRALFVDALSAEELTQIRRISTTLDETARSYPPCESVVAAQSEDCPAAPATTSEK